MSVLQYIDPQNPARFWLTGTLGKSTRQRKVRKKKSNSLNMKKRKKQLSLSHIQKDCDEIEGVWGCFQKPVRDLKANKVNSISLII